ncbi:MAG: hypothetical protein GC192_11015 [Bacteroidetes bacterium]|nr:hypothetical protein [Bacteroidota bacterium]
MAGPKKKFQGRHEEQPAVAQFLLSSFNRDLALFTDYSGDFNAAYATNFAAQIASVNTVVYPLQLTKEGKLVTARIATNLDRLKTLNKLVESYVDRAGAALTVAPDDFGCRDLRKKLSKKDVEAVITSLRTVLQNMDANLTALTAKGLKAATKTEMAALPAALTTDNTLQNDNIQARNQLMNDNIDLFDALFEAMQDVSKTGKVIHSTLSGTPERVPDYTMAVLLRRVRAERKKGGGDTPVGEG